MALEAPQLETIAKVLRGDVSHDEVCGMSAKCRAWIAAGLIRVTGGRYLLEGGVLRYTALRTFEELVGWPSWIAPGKAFTNEGYLLQVVREEGIYRSQRRPGGSGQTRFILTLEPCAPLEAVVAQFGPQSPGVATYMARVDELFTLQRQSRDMGDGPIA